MAKVKLISEQYIKERSVIEHNADAKILSMVVDAVQDIQLKQILGKDLYDSTIAKVADMANTPLDTATKSMLDDYILPFLAYAVLCDFVYINGLKTTNKGNMKLSDNNASPASGQDVEVVKNYYENYKNSAKQNLIDYLKDNNLLATDADLDVTTSTVGWYLRTHKHDWDNYGWPWSYWWH